MSPEVPKSFTVEKRRVIRRPVETPPVPAPEVSVTVSGLKHLKEGVWRGIVNGTINGKTVTIEVTWHPERTDPAVSQADAKKFGPEACLIACQEARKVFVGRMEGPK